MKTLTFFIFLAAIALSGCSKSPKVHSFGSTSAERVTAMTNLIQKTTSIPGSILDVECIEEQQGDGRLGPSDFFFFAKIVVEKSDFDSWKSIAGNPISNWDYLSPSSGLSWWPTKTVASKLDMYSPKRMFNRSNGWIGFSDDGQTIYVLTFTM